MYSAANAKLKELAKNPAMDKFINIPGRKRSRKVYSFDLLSGHSCPFAETCLSKVMLTDGERVVSPLKRLVDKLVKWKRIIVDGANMKFRCFSASQEATFTNTYNKRLNNFESLRHKTTAEIVDIICDTMPNNLGVCRIHVAGDFFNKAYFRAWIQVAILNPDRLFYAYTKSLPYWLEYLGIIPENLILTASKGGRCDTMIEQLSLRSTVVVFSYAEAERLGLEVDHDDSHAANPETKNQDFALIIHGIQRKGTDAAAAIKELKLRGDKFSYSK